MKSILGYEFKNPALLKQACTHPSYKHIDRSALDYERMEFLGDAILNAVMAALLYKKYPDFTEGQLSILHASLINKKILAKIAANLNLGEALIIDRGEEKIGGRNNVSNLENLLEAITGAVFLDSDYNTAQNFVLNLWEPYMQSHTNNVSIDVELKNPKSRLQELMQSQGKAIPKYSLKERSGEDHAPIFIMQVELEGLPTFEGSGHNKKEAEATTAINALKYLEKQV